ncbi:transposable element Tcb2 transposase [Trichonephila clavipes]|nr:transposable element Tcb2 transposase [Trichonephila clavipes]
MSLDSDLLNVDERLRIWLQSRVVMDPACQIGTVQRHGSSIMHGNGLFQQDNCTSHKSRLATGWFDEQSSDFSVINWPPRIPDIDPIETRGEKPSHSTNEPH